MNFSTKSKKFTTLIIISLLLTFLVISFFHFNNNSCFAESESYRVHLDSCSVFFEPNSSLGEDNIKETKNYGETLLIDNQLILDLSENSNLKYYAVIDETNNIIGYVLSTSVINSNESEIKIKLQTNATLNSDSEIFVKQGDEFVSLKYENQDVKLTKDTKIRILEKYDKKNKYTQISFEYNDEILTGYVLTNNIKISGFNYYLLIAIFLLVIVGTTVIPIVVKNWKKKKKAANS